MNLVHSSPKDSEELRYLKFFWLRTLMPKDKTRHSKFSWKLLATAGAVAAIAAATAPQEAEAHRFQGVHRPIGIVNSYPRNVALHGPFVSGHSFFYYSSGISPYYNYMQWFPQAPVMIVQPQARPIFYGVPGFPAQPSPVSRQEPSNSSQGNATFNQPNNRGTINNDVTINNLSGGASPPEHEKPTYEFGYSGEICFEQYASEANSLMNYVFAEVERRGGQSFHAYAFKDFNGLFTGVRDGNNTLVRKFHYPRESRMSGPEFEELVESNLGRLGIDTAAFVNVVFRSYSCGQ